VSREDWPQEKSKMREFERQTFDVPRRAIAGGNGRMQDAFAAGNGDADSISRLEPLG
jgi:hypothetical protein